MKCFVLFWWYWFSLNFCEIFCDILLCIFLQNISLNISHIHIFAKRFKNSTYFTMLYTVFYSTSLQMLGRVGLCGRARGPSSSAWGDELPEACAALGLCLWPGLYLQLSNAVRWSRCNNRDPALSSPGGSPFTVAKAWSQAGSCGSASARRSAISMR